ncbi:MAG: hypothetical protein Q8M95_12910 [Candidatus Methanoperedens sp.]|nr:hypothetical protein [Candidatus Methanoperedens sp.]
MRNDQIKTEDYLIGEKPFLAIFLQSKAGYEDGVIKNLKNTLSEIKIDKTFLDLNSLKILKCFGHFDIAILFNLDKLDINVESFETISLEVSKIDNVNDSSSIVGYSWDFADDFQGSDFCWGISSMKLDLKNSNGAQNPIKIEKKVIKEIIQISNKDNIKIKVFGGLGWNEIIIIINSTSLKNISKFVYNIRVFDDILDISTIPAVEWDCWNNKKLETIPNCQILITHRSRRESPIRDLLILLAEKFKVNIDKNGQEDIGLIFGGFDIRLPLVNSELNNIIKFVLGIRTIKTITKTNTIFTALQIPSDMSLLPIDLPNYLLDKEACIIVHEKSIEIPIKNRASKLIDILDNEIRHLYCEYKELRNDDYTKSLYFDLSDFFNDLYSNINHARELETEAKKMKDFSQKRKLDILLEQLKKIIQSIEFSIYQRISGMQMSYLMEAKHTGFEKFGGIQRIILATEAIPSQIINQKSEKNWNGFCVFGSEPDFIAQSVGEVISIPFEYKYQPEKWWGLGHEIGHLLINRMKKQILVDFNDAILINFESDFKNFKKNLEKINIHDKELLDEYRNRELEFINETIVEICADYLNFKTIFFSDWNSFLNCTLNYLDSRGYDVLSETRLFRAISISEHINKGGVAKDKVLFTTIKNIRNFDKYDEIHLKDRIDIIKNQTFLPYLKTVDEILDKIDDILSIDLNNELLKEIDYKLNRGEIVENKFDLNSNLITIYILKSLINRDLNKDITFKLQITSILSLQNFRVSK